MIMMDFQKAYDRINRTTMLDTLVTMNVDPYIIELIQLLYVYSSSIIVINNKKGTRFIF